jgi:t-SNARE complex subunit (syntaxin)
MSPDVMKLGWEILVTICGLGGGVVGMWATLNFAKREIVSTALATQSERLTKIETELKHAVTHKDIKELSASIHQIGQRVSGMESRVSEMHHLVTVLHDNLMRD